MQEKQFVTMPVKKVFFKLAMPGMLSMVFSSIYMMSDGIFVGRFIGEHALAAVSLVMPIVMIIFALSNMIAVGAAVKVSTALGEGKIDKAKRLFSASVLIIIGLGAIFMLFGALGAKSLIFAVIKDAILADMAYKYVRVFIFALPFIMPLFAMDNFLRACGKAKYTMWLNIIVSILNIFLDWLFIAYFRFGIEYSAISSVISMLLGAIFSFAPFFTKKMTLHFAKPKMSRAEFIGIIYNGSSEFFSSIANSFISVIINAFLISFGGAIAVASFGIVMNIDTLMIGILYGVLDAVQPAVSYNVGAGEIKRTFSFFKVASITTAIVSAICMTVIMVFPKALTSIFIANQDAEIIGMTVVALRMFAPSYLFTWFNMLTSAFLTAMDKPKGSMIIMAFRTVIFPMICLFALTPFLKLNGVFFTATAAGALTFIIALIIWIKTAKKMRLQINITQQKAAEVSK